MPLPHRIEGADSLRPTGLTMRSGVRAAPQIEGRRPTDTEQQRRRRKRRRAGCHAPRQGQLDPWWEEPRNGLPVRLYVYQGSGRDAYDGSCLFDEVTT